MAGRRGGAAVSGRRVLVVVSSERDAAGLPEGSVVTADRFLEGGGDLGASGAVVVNLCRSCRYGSKGYYVSLLADARGQQAVPSVETLEGLADGYGLFRALSEVGISCLDAEEMQARRRAMGAKRNGNGDAVYVRAELEEGEDGARAFRPAEAGEVLETTAILGTATDPRFRQAALSVFREWPLPAMRIGFVREDGGWKVTRVVPVALHRLRRGEREALGRTLADERLVLRRGTEAPRELKRASIAVLFDEHDPFRASTPETIDRLERVAARMNVFVHRIGLDDLDRLGEYDALFIRALTGVSEPSFPFALRAEALDMPVVDDSQSIIRCSNKVFLHELLCREGVPTPRTLVLTSRTPWKEIERGLGLPFVVKLPDGSFSAAVHRCGSQAEYRKLAPEMLRRSPLLIAQEWLPTEFDWRVTVLGGRLLFAARYHMARGHWQIRSAEKGTERYGRVEAVPRDQAPADVAALAVRAASLIGKGLYGVDLKETPDGPVVIEINDNPNLDIGYEDAADGNAIYEDVVTYFVERIEEGTERPAVRAGSEDEDGERAALARLRKPIPGRGGRGDRRHYRPFSVAGMELEYPVVDRDLNVAPLVEPAFRVLAGRGTSGVDLGAVGFSNEIADHVLEVKTTEPVESLAAAESLLVEGIRRFSALLRDEFDARLMPTGMHPWMDPARGRVWTRSSSRIYRTYERLFDLRAHGWMNVQASHLSLPMGREVEAVAMYNAAALLIPHLPALAASTPMHDGELQAAADGRLAWILEHQARIPESQGEIVPEYVESLADYRRRILAPMYAALDRLPDTRAIRHDFFNARGAVFKAGGKRMEVRVLDTQECVRMDVAVGVFVRSALKHFAERVMAGRVHLPPHAVLVSDFREAIRDGSRARVLAPHFGEVPRDAEGRACVRDVLRAVLDAARRTVRRDEAAYLELAGRVIEAGSLSERIRAELEPYADDDEAFTDQARRVYIELMDCLEANEPWARRGL
jgi:glutathione synthase/RimK-type ligase-like ATP-grasp enzyme/gamma-glutamyl:cysteine ligase YbdK (ATP-grasp superfamily)